MGILLYAIIPSNIRDVLRSIRCAIMPQAVSSTLRFIRLQKSATKLFGPLYKINQNTLDINITYSCNLKCYNCCNSCRQAPSEDYMSVEQIGRFIKESIGQKRKWGRIAITGGEGTLHPCFFDIIQLLLSYKEDFSRPSNIELYTNGFGLEVNNVLRRIPKEIAIVNTKKQSIAQYFYSFNVAPLDLKINKNTDYSNGCQVAQICGIGLNRYGYYMCALGGGIDRVFGFDIGRKSLPAGDDLMIEQRKILCQYCGYFKTKLDIITAEEMSSTWKYAYENYKRKKPSLSLY